MVDGGPHGTFCRKRISNYWKVVRGWHNFPLLLTANIKSTVIDF